MHNQIIFHRQQSPELNNYRIEIRFGPSHQPTKQNQVFIYQNLTANAAFNQAQMAAKQVKRI